MAEQKFPLGQLLIEKGIITQEQLEVALQKQKETGELLGIVLLEMGFVNEEIVFMPVLAGQMGVEYTNLKDLNIARDIVLKIPAKIAMHYQVMPFDMKDQILQVATDQPMNIQILDELSVVLGFSVQFVLASRKDIRDAIKKYYGVGAETIEQIMDSVQIETQEEGQGVLEEIDSEASIGKFINQIIFEAYKQRATDIHIEPFEDELKVRYRIDGVLKDAQVPGNLRVFKEAINSRIKILSNLNIAEKRIPQDGRFKVRIEKNDIDLRVSFIPTAFGESVVLRLLNTTQLFKVEQLGLNPRERQMLIDLTQKPHGIIFLTGPTGSGKTTTLYSCLSRVNQADRKIITIEDPVEYQLKGVIQIQVHPKVGLTFAQGLRSCLRHDPDILMVGEVRDLETAEIAIQSALTGHLIFSTLHTNDAAGGITRLVDMGVEPYLIASTVQAFIAQRLLRLLCDRCKEPIGLTPDAVKDLDQDFVKEMEGHTFYQAKGCPQCHFTGYKGRVAIYEFLMIDDDVRALVMKNVPSGEIRNIAVRNGMRTLRRSGWEKVKQGLTSLAEVVRVTQDKE